MIVGVASYLYDNLSTSNADIQNLNEQQNRILMQRTTLVTAIRLGHTPGNSKFKNFHAFTATLFHKLMFELHGWKVAFVEIQSPLNS